MTDQPLEPCPFCGWKLGKIEGVMGERQVLCRGCKASTGKELTDELAIKAWNTRTPEGENNDD